MKNLLKEIWRGDIALSDISGKRRKTEIHRQEETRENYKELLSEEMNEKQGNILDKYDDSVSELISIYQEEAFIDGVRFAVKLLAEAII